MKALAALATLGFVCVIGTSASDAQEKHARLTSPTATPSIIEMHDTATLGGDRAVSLIKLGLSEVERIGIETAVRGQIRALASRNADAAFGYLTPVIQDFFSGPDAFVATLTRQVPPVMQARGFALAGLEREAMDAVQHVLFTGAEGTEWLAQFTVERQIDGSWRIKGCKVDRVQGQNT